MKTLEGDYIPIDQPRFMEGEMMQYSEQTLKSNMAAVILEGKEATLIPLDAETLSVNQIDQYLNKIHRDGFFEYIKNQEVKKIKRVTLATAITEEEEVIIQIHEEARIGREQYPNHQTIHFLTSAEEAFSACIIPISEPGGTPNLPLSAILIMPTESTIPEIRELSESLRNTREYKKRIKVIEDIPLVDYRDLPRKNPNT